MNKGSELMTAGMAACPEVNERLLPMQKGCWIGIVSSLQLHNVSNRLFSFHTESAHAENWRMQCVGPLRAAAHKT